jgi:hypothetical protein
MYLRVESPSMRSASTYILCLKKLLPNLRLLVSVVSGECHPPPMSPVTGSLPYSRRADHSLPIQQAEPQSQLQQRISVLTVLQLPCDYEASSHGVPPFSEDYLAQAELTVQQLSHHTFWLNLSWSPCLLAPAVRPR